MKIRTVDDCLKLQADIDRFSEWSHSLGLSLNLSKCNIFTFYKLKFPIYYPYSIDEINIVRESNYVSDLGIRFSHNLDMKLHIENVCCKAFKILGFVMRLAKDFKLGTSLKILFCALVRPILEYGCLIWSPYTAADSSQLERVQRKFLRFVSFTLNINCPPHDYSSISSLLGLPSLAERRRIAGIRFVKDLLDGRIDSSDLTSLLCFKVPQRSTRNTIPFYVPHASTNYLKNEPIRRLMTNANLDPTFNY